MRHFDIIDDHGKKHRASLQLMRINASACGEKYEIPGMYRMFAPDGQELQREDGFLINRRSERFLYDEDTLDRLAQEELADLIVSNSRQMTL